MSKNLMPEVLKMLGVTYGEDFKLQAPDPELYKNYSFYFDKDCELYIVNNLNGSTGNFSAMLHSIMRGYYKIIKIPWRPKEGDKYYSVSLPTKSICVEIWHNETSDYALKALDMVYRSAEEAEAHMAEDYERLTGRKLKNDA